MTQSHSLAHLQADVKDDNNFETLTRLAVEKTGAKGMLQYHFTDQAVAKIFLDWVHKHKEIKDITKVSIQKSIHSDNNTVYIIRLTPQQKQQLNKKIKSQDPIQDEKIVTQEEINQCAITLNNVKLTPVDFKQQLEKYRTEIINRALIIKNQLGETILHATAQYQTFENFILLLKKTSTEALNQALVIQSNSKCTALHMIARYQSSKALIQVINKMSTDALNQALVVPIINKKWTALHVIAQYQSSEAFIKVIDKISNEALNQALVMQTDDKFTALRMIAQHQSSEAFIKVITKASAEAINTALPLQNNVDTALHEIVYTQSEKAVLALIKKASTKTLSESCLLLDDTNTSVLEIALPYQPPAVIAALLTKIDDKSLKLIIAHQNKTSRLTQVPLGYLFFEPSWQIESLMTRLCNLLPSEIILFCCEVYLQGKEIPSPLLIALQPHLANALKNIKATKSSEQYQEIETIMLMQKSFNIDDSKAIVMPNIKVNGDFKDIKYINDSQQVTVTTRLGKILSMVKPLNINKLFLLSLFKDNKDNKDDKISKDSKVAVMPDIKANGIFKNIKHLNDSQQVTITTRLGMILSVTLDDVESFKLLYREGLKSPYDYHLLKKHNPNGIMTQIADSLHRAGQLYAGTFLDLDLSRYRSYSDRYLEIAQQGHAIFKIIKNDDHQDDKGNLKNDWNDFKKQLSNYNYRPQLRKPKTADAQHRYKFHHRENFIIDYEHRKAADKKKVYLATKKQSATLLSKNLNTTVFGEHVPGRMLVGILAGLTCDIHVVTTLPPASQLKPNEYIFIEDEKQTRALYYIDDNQKPHKMPLKVLDEKEGLPHKALSHWTEDEKNQLKKLIHDFHDHRVNKALFTRDKGTYHRGWIGDEKDVKDYQQKMKEINYTDFDKFREKVNQQPHQLNEILTKFTQHSILAIMIASDDLASRKVAIARCDEVKKEFNLDLPIIFYNRNLRTTRIYSLGEQDKDLLDEVNQCAEVLNAKLTPVDFKQQLEKYRTEIINRALIIKNQLGETILHATAQYQTFENFILLLKKTSTEAFNQALVIQNNEGRTALHVMVQYQLSEAFIKVIDKISNEALNQALVMQADNKFTALRMIAQHQSSEAFIKVITKASAEAINTALPLQNDVDTALHEIVYTQSEKAVLAFIEKASTQALSQSCLLLNYIKKSVLEEALRYQTPAVIAALLSKIDDKSFEFMLIHQHKSPEFTQALLEYLFFEPSWQIESLMTRLCNLLPSEIILFCCEVYLQGKEIPSFLLTALQPHLDNALKNIKATNVSEQYQEIEDIMPLMKPPSLNESNDNKDDKTIIISMPDVKSAVYIKDIKHIYDSKDEIEIESKKLEIEQNDILKLLSNAISDHLEFTYNLESKAWNKSSLKIDYINNRVKNILRSEKERLKESNRDVENEPRINILETIINEIDAQILSYRKTVINSKDLKANVASIIEKELVNNNLDRYKSWGVKLGLAILNVLFVIPVFTLAIKYFTTGTCFFSIKGKSYEAAKDACANIKRMKT